MDRPRSFPAKPALSLTVDDAVEALGNRAFGVSPHIDFIKSLSGRLDIDLSGTIAVMGAMPVLLNANAHRKVRISTAEFLALDRKKRKIETQTQMRATFARMLDAKEGSINLLKFLRLWTSFLK